MMDVTKKIKAALAYADSSQAELAKLYDTSLPNINQRIKRGKFNLYELEDLAEKIGCKFEAYFVFEDGTKI